jgi:hypothetical protein
MNDGSAALTAPLTLDTFLDQVRASNPFLDNRINAPSARDVDVPSIHHHAFEQLTELAHEALAAGRGIGAMLWGQAGIGKSHVLSRLGRWAAQDRRACFVYLHNLQAAPEALPRSVLHAVVSILTEGRQNNLGLTPLFELVRAGLLQAVAPAGPRVSWSQLQQAHAAWLDRLAVTDVPGAGLIDRSVYEVLYRFFVSTYRGFSGHGDGHEARLAVRWLCGVPLDPAQARILGLPPPRSTDEPVALADGQEIKQVLVALCRLAACRQQPFVLVFDQVDNLDAEQVGALSRFLEALIDSAPNLLAITAGIQTTLVPWHDRGVITDSAWDRLAQFRILLSRLHPGEALAILRARIDAFLAPYSALEPVWRKRQADSLFPLGRDWMEQYLADKKEIRPRDAVNAAREGWRRQQEELTRQGGPAWLERWPMQVAAGEKPAASPEEQIDHAVEQAMREHQEQCVRVPGSMPPDGDHLAGLLFALLEQCRDGGHLFGIQEVERLPPPRRGMRPTYDLAVTQRPHDGGMAVRTGIVMVAVPNAISVTGFLRRLVEDPRPLDRVILVTDTRIGLALGARGDEYLRELQQAGPERFAIVELTEAEYAELSALEQPISLARSRDLEIDVQPGQTRLITEREVMASHRRCGRYARCRLLNEVLAAVRSAEPPAAGAAAAGDHSAATVR